MIIKGGYTNYGQSIGILMLDTKFPRPIGDVGNAKTFPFPVRFKKVIGASPNRIVKEADLTLLEPFITAGQELINEGVKGISTSCGFLAMFQREMAAALDVPVFTSSLLQVPFAHTIMGNRGKVGILTARKQSLTEKHFKGVGMENIPKAIEGMDDMEEFTSVFIENKVEMDFELSRREMGLKAKILVENNPDVNVIVMECTNMPPFRDVVKEVTGLPVFDIVTLINYINSIL
jgi:hypothetical protein